MTNLHTDGAVGTVFGYTSTGFTNSTQVAIHAYHTDGTPQNATVDLIVMC